MDAANFLTLRRLQRALENGDPQTIGLYYYTARRSENRTVRELAKRYVQTSERTYGSAA